TVSHFNHPPTAGDVPLTVAQDTSNNAWSPVVSDPDGDALGCTIAGAAVHGSASVAADCSRGSDTPHAGYNASYSFTHHPSATHVPSTTLFRSTASHVNHPPTAGDVPLTVAQDTSNNAWSPVVSDPDGDALGCTIAGAAVHGSASVA